MLTTYALLPRDAAELGKRRFHLLILDEAQNIKNATTKPPSPPASWRHGIACA